MVVQAHYKSKGQIKGGTNECRRERRCDGTDAADHRGEGEQRVSVLGGIQLRREQVQ